MAIEGAWAPAMIVWIASCGVLLMYWLVIFLPLLWHRPGKGEISEKVSVVICIHELTPQFPALLASLSQQDYPNYEVMVVNDGGHAEISTALEGQQVKEIRHTPDDRSPGKKQALAAGIRAAEGPWVLLTDADCRVGRMWVSSMISCVAEDRELVLGFGPLTQRTGLVNLLARFDNLLVGLQSLGWASWGRPYMGVGRNLLYRRELFVKSDGFEGHTDLGSGDDDLFVQSVANRKNTGICLDPASFVWSPAKETLAGLLHQKRRHVSTGPRYTSGHQLRLAGFALSWIIWWWGGLLLAGLAPSQSFLMLAIGTGLLQWLVLVLLARKLRVRSVALWFVPLSLLYSGYLVIQGLLMAIGPPSTWKRS